MPPYNHYRCPGCLPSIPPDPATATPAERAAHAGHLRRLAAVGTLPNPTFHPYPQLPHYPMSLAGFYTPADAARARQHRSAEVAEAQQRAAELRYRHEQAAAYLRHLLPFTWQAAKVRPRYQGLPVWERAPAALHLQLLEPLTLATGTQPAQARAVGDWLCLAALDTSTGALRYESEPAPWHSDGTGGPEANYLPAPTCQRCLKRVQLLLAHPYAPTRA